MKITGVIVLDKMAGRQEGWVTTKVENDYFLALQITKIDDHEITTCESAFQALKTNFPSITIGEEEVNELFQTPILPRGAKDIVHVTLGNFGDFRYNRDVANIVDQDKVANAEELDGQMVTFELANNAFEVVSTSDFSNLLVTNAKVTQTKNVGFGRDTVINLSPSEKEQAIFQKISAQVFGKDFKLWNANKIPVPYHITIAQTNGLNAKLVQANNNSLETERTSSLEFSSM